MFALDNPVLMSPRENGACELCPVAIAHVGERHREGAVNLCTGKCLEKIADAIKCREDD